MKTTPKRRVKQNIWGNWKGYEGTRLTQDFGTDVVTAGYWVESGIVDYNEGYSDIEKYKTLAHKGDKK